MKRTALCLLFACSLAGYGSDQAADHAKRAQAAIQANNSDLAIEELQALLRIEPNNVNAIANLGMVQFTRGDYGEATTQFNRAIGLLGNTRKTDAVSGAQPKGLPSSFPVRRREPAPFALSPALWSARAFLGMCAMRLGRADEGQSLLEASFPHLTDKSLRIQAGLELMKAYSAAGRLEKAESVLAALESLDPANPEILYSMYRLHSEFAAAALQKLSLQDSDSAWVHEILGQNFMAQEQYSTAAREYREALKRAPRLLGLHAQLGLALFLAARTEANRSEAEKEFLAELAINPGDADSLYRLGEIYRERSDVRRAKENFSRAVALRPNFADAHIELGEILASEGDIENAIAHMEAAERLSPNGKTAHYRLAQLYRAKGRSQDAERELALFKQLSAGEHGSGVSRNPAN